MRHKLLLCTLLILLSALTSIAAGRYNRSRGDDVVYIDMRRAGDLESEMPTGMHNRVRVLVVEGPINGKDFAYMKRLAQRSRVVNRDDKSVDNYIDIDLADARIESGGGGIFSSTRSTRDEVPSYALSSGSHLRSIVLPPRTTMIGSHAFYGCSDLEEVIMDRRVVEMGESAFEDCTRLRYIDLSPDLRSLGDKCFDGCTSLSSVRLPQDLTSIGAQCFRNAPLTRLELPYGVTHIGTAAFEGTRLRSLFIPAEAVIEKDNPGRMKYLTEFAVERGSRNYYAADGLLYTADGAMLLVCPQGRTGTINVPEGVTTLSGAAFNGCSSVQRVMLPASVRTIEPYAFAGSGIAAFILPDAVTVVPAHAFEECSSLRSVSLHDDVVSIGEYAFARCNNLTDFELPYGLRDLGEHAFYKCTSLPAIDVPDGVTQLPLAVFQDCESATRITLPPGLTVLGKEAIRNCKRLTHIDLPQSLTTIEKEAFRDCKSLRAIDIPAAVSTIGDNAFRNTALSELVLPAGLTHIGKKITESCKLSRIVIHATTPPELDKVNDNKVPLYVPAEAVDAYKSAKNWKNFKSITAL